ncbi:3768_t:CDS:1, partial [Scutellospora calospora]
PESPTWSVRSLLLPPVKDKSDQKWQEVKITQHEFLNLLKMAKLNFPNSSSKKSNIELENNEISDPQTALNKDISILCNFVRHVQNIDVSNIEPLKSFWTTEIEIGFRNDDVANCRNNDVDVNEKDMKDCDGSKQERLLLKSAKVLYGNYYVVRNISD